MTPVVRYLVYTGVIVVITGVFVLSEINHPGSMRLLVFDSAADTLGTSEYSPVEMLHVLLLFACTLVLFAVAYVYPEQRPIAFLFGGIAAAGAIRESDLFLDRFVLDNFWQVPVALIAALLIVYSWRNHRRFRIAWSRTWPSPGLTLIYAGALIEFVFAQFIGHEPLWQAISGDGYQRVVKVAVEEIIESIGYLLWIVGTIEYAIQARAVAAVWKPEAKAGESRRRSRSRAASAAKKRY